MRQRLINSFIIMLVLATAYSYFEKPELADKIRVKISSFIASKPCSKPIAYSIGEFDKRFGISKTKFRAISASAEKIWEDAAGRNLFDSTENGKLKVNLIYDYRQAATEKLRSIGLVIKGDRDTFDTLKSKYESLLGSYKSAKTSYEKELASLEVDKVEYEKQVEYWNSHGGAPKDEYQKLEEKRLALNSGVAVLNANQGKLNDTADTLNSLVTVINGLIDDLNLHVSKYNDTSSKTGEEFNEGEYVQDENGERINVYQYADEAKLLRVLAHELGHALGLSHVDDPKAIMYKLNKSANEKPTSADITELQHVCMI